ncbi:dihydroorotase [Saccharolobus caldissimus]|uniref:Dihydroorotase-like protein n=1 Tax=Saccharolobus caldissimus TaxID=1702097 RepID=A0AAQ4CUF3_9CREN|nr:amidohydrolase family protein [Saccharolobus caldissimus]BDB99434.1 dihydroorotase-like protein [Saccharolobus caldissimus]
MEYDLIIKGGKVVFPGQYIIEADLGINEGKIVTISKNINSNSGKIINAEGKIIIPGVIDAHFHIGIYRNFMDDALSESRSAIAGGVTTILSYFRTGRNYLNVQENYITLLPKLLEMSAGHFYTDYGFNLAPITESHIKEIPNLIKEFGITTFKFYMFYKGLNLKSAYMRNAVEREYLLSDTPYDLGHLYNIMKTIANYNANSSIKARLSIHAEESEIIRIFLEEAKNLETINPNLDPLEIYDLARPPIAERIAIVEAFELARITNCPINILHVSSKEALNTILELKHNHPEVDVKTEVTVSHLTLNTEMKIGIKGKVNPPIRHKEDNERLWEGILKDEIDTIGSDHAAIERNRKGDNLWNAENGYGATELIIPALITEGYYKRKIPLEHLIKFITMNPAKVFNLSNRKGNILLGYDADLAIIDINEEKKVTADILHSAQDFTPFEGLVLKGWPKITILRGNVIYENGEIIEKPIGQYLKRPL